MLKFVHPEIVGKARTIRRDVLAVDCGISSRSLVRSRLIGMLESATRDDAWVYERLART